jgi:hypothetical protein
LHRPEFLVTQNKMICCRSFSFGLADEAAELGRYDIPIRF